jgi:hypothetical protein
MKAALALGIALISIALAAVTTGQAFATTATHAKAPATLKVVMSDPGCHWFAVGAKLKLTATVAGPVRLANFDEAALKVKGNGITKRIPVGKQLLLRTGHYAITMVGQAPDDNHLKLTVK